MPVLKVVAVFFLGGGWGGENRCVYRWNFIPIFLPYLKVSGVRCQE